MNYFFILFIPLILYKECLQEKSDEFYRCIDPTKIVSDPSECTKIIIPVQEGFKCCSMKVVYNNNSNYNCFVIESKYSISKETIQNYINERSIDAFFENTGGQIEIDCGDRKVYTKIYKKKSDNYLNCYKGHINMVENEENCNYDIPDEEGGKCCFIETYSQNFATGLTTEDKRCFIINEKYFKEDKNLSDFLKEESNLNNLEQIKNTNITIKCKNYNPYNFNTPIDLKYNPNNTDDQLLPIPRINFVGINIDNNNIQNDDLEDIKNDDKNNENNGNKKEEKSGIKVWVIIVIIISAVILICIVGFVIRWLIKRKKLPGTEINANESEHKVKKQEILQTSEKT